MGAYNKSCARFRMLQYCLRERLILSLDVSSLLLAVLCKEFWFCFPLGARMETLEENILYIRFRGSHERRPADFPELADSL